MHTPVRELKDAGSGLSVHFIGLLNRVRVVEYNSR